MTMMAAGRDRRLRRFVSSAENAVARLVCLPHAGGAASAFRSWPGLLDRRIEVLAACYPGRQDRIAEAVPTDLETLADDFVEALLALPPLVTVLFGHSMGASLAHEMAVRLSRAGRPPAVLMVSGRRPPSGLDHRAPAVGSDDHAILADVRSLGDPSSAVLDDPDLAELVLPAIRADYAMIGRYRPALPEIRLPVEVFLGDRDPRLGTADGAAWSEVTSGSCRVHVFDGGHFYLVDKAAELTLLVQQITLAAASGRS